MPGRSGDAILMPTHHTNAKRVCPACGETGASTGTRAPAMTKAVIDILGPDVLMHQSDYPHGEAHFPDTAQMVLDWPIWDELGRDVLQRHMAGNAERFLRMA
jgi:hypothetical protein